MKPLFNFIENISLIIRKVLNRTTTITTRVDKINKNIGYDLRGTDSASTGKEELPLPSNVSSHTEFKHTVFTQNVIKAGD